MSKLGLLWRTARHLTGRQALYQLIHRLRGRAKLRLPELIPATYFLTGPDACKPVSWQAGTFTFLNQAVVFRDEMGQETINWNYARNGKLWTYYLNYFDFLNQPAMTANAGLGLIQDFIAQTGTLKDGLEPYPTSLRIGNWVQFLSRHRLRNPAVNAHLFAQSALLSQRLEYHLAGNHLLENGFALLTGAMYFRQRSWFQKAATLLRAELTAQVLADGGHNERSPMYHQVLVDRLLDAIHTLRHNDWQPNSDLLHFLTDRAFQMLSWLEGITFRNGDVPMLNDAAWQMAPTTVQIRAKAGRVLPALAIAITAGTWGGERSGYRMMRQSRCELVADAGPVGPDHQPGHGHADTLSFVLYVDNCPIIVDSGTSTYQIGLRRAWERSTAAHNTVEVAGQNSSEVWAGFRVGRRARVTILNDTETTLTARHDGYRRFGVTHERTWSVEPVKLCILDRLIGIKGTVGIARFYFHPDVPVTLTGNGVTAGPVFITFVAEKTPDLCLADCEIATGFNRLKPSQCLDVTFVDTLKTILTPTA